jgi:hypothetical protein
VSLGYSLLLEPAIFFLRITFATSTMSDNSEETLGQAIGEAIDETYQEMPLMDRPLPGITSQHMKFERYSNWQPFHIGRQKINCCKYV